MAIGAILSFLPLLGLGAAVANALNSDGSPKESHIYKIRESGIVFVVIDGQRRPVSFSMATNAGFDIGTDRIPLIDLANAELIPQGSNINLGLIE